MSAESKARTSDEVLRYLSWFILLVGGLLGAIALVVGFTVDEPWYPAGVTITEDLQSIGLGMLAAATIAALTGVLWGVVQTVRAVLWYVARKGSTFPS